MVAQFSIFFIFSLQNELFSLDGEFAETVSQRTADGSRNTWIT